MEGVLKIGKPAAERPHILAIPYCYMGHMTPVIQLCRILIAKTGCAVTIACNEADIPSLYRLLPENLEDHHIQVLPISDGLPSLDPSVPVSWDYVRNMLVHAHEEGLACSFEAHIHRFSDVVCVISDVFLSWTQDVACRLGVPRIAVWVSAAAEHQVYLHGKELIKAGKLPFRAPPGRDDKDVDNMIPNVPGQPPLYHRVDGICEGEEEIKLPALPGLNRRDFPTFLQIEDSSDELFHTCIDRVNKCSFVASMVLFNTFEALEGNLLDTLRLQGTRAHPIGPLFLLEDLILNNVQAGAMPDCNGSSDEEYSECFKWLDRQEPKSVIYVAFGTVVQLSKAQVRELALGILRSEQPFIWAYRKPTSDVEGEGAMPEGFLDQVKDRGFVLEWVPQKRILNHPSIGGFLSHCGWNSCLETICFGVPMVGFPQITDQYLHCKLMVEEFKVGLRLERRPDEGNIAVAADIASLFRELLAKGNQLRKRAAELKEAAERSIRPGGCSHNTLDAIIKLVKKR